MSENSNRSEEVQALITKAVDEELTASEKSQLEDLMAKDPTLADEIDGLTQVGQLLSGYRLRDPNPGDWLAFERSLGGRTARWFGWLLLAVGVIVLGGAAVVAMLTDPGLPLIVKLGLSAVIAGAGVLLLYVGRVFFREHRDDPYKDVVR